MGVLRLVNKSIDELKSQLNYFKRELFNIPKSKEAEFKNKHTEYQEKIANFEREAKRLDLLIKGDERGLLAMEHGLDQQ